MKPSKIIVRALAVLGFGSAVGLASGCGANRAQKSRPSETVPTADTIVIEDGSVPIRVMYGVPPARFDSDKPIPQRGDPQT